MSRKHREAEALFNAKGYDRLAAYNSERARGIAHTLEHVAEMAVLQAQFNAEQLAEAKRKGWTIIGNAVANTDDGSPTPARAVREAS